MQDAPGAIPHWLFESAKVVTFLGLGSVLDRLLTLYLNRKKPAAEIHESTARSDKARAEARLLNAQATSELDDIIERLHLRIDQMQIGIDEIREDRDTFKGLAARQRIELDFAEKQMKRVKGLLDAHGIKLSDLDKVE